MEHPKTTVIKEQKEVLGSKIRITLVVSGGISARQDVKNARQKMAEAFNECQRIENEYSRFKKSNQLSKLNSTKGKWQPISPELYFLLKEGLKISKKTDGLFDLGVKEILENWGYDSNYSFRDRDENEITSAGASTSTSAGAASGTTAGTHDPKKIPKFSYQLKSPNLVKLNRTIELGGLGKGYALDRMAEIFKEFPNFCIDAGGDIYAKGSPNPKRQSGPLTGRGQADETGWKILFEHPQDITMAIGQVTASGYFLAASNPLKRRWGTRHHLVDPVTAQPANKMLAVYTQAKTGLLADAYSTALYILGYEKAKSLLTGLPVQAMLVSPKGEIYRTKNFKGELFIS